MGLKIVKDGYSHVFGSIILCGLIGLGLHLAGLKVAAVIFWALGVILASFMFYFFRDPERLPPVDDSLIVAGADGLVRAIEEIRESRHLATDTVRISVFLSPFNVHVNRSPMGGTVSALSYTPGKHLLTISNASSEHNEHSSILIDGPRTRCLVRQIVGPIVRRVVYWLQMNQPIQRGERIGMMKFGSRLDMYFPKTDVQVLVKKGDKVVAGVTPIAKIVKGEHP